MSGVLGSISAVGEDGGGGFGGDVAEVGSGAVSYTHLTLPTIYSV